MSDSVEVMKPTDVDEVVCKPSVLPGETPVRREVIPWPMWRTAFLIASQSFMYGYIFAGLNTGLVTGKHGNGSDCYHGTESCPPGSVYKDINMSTIEASVATALSVVGTWIGTAIAGKPSEMFGRKKTLLANTALFVLGAILSAVGNYAALCIGRFFSGLGVGVAIAVAPVLLAELASPATRGTITTLHQLLLTFGILVVSVVGYGFVTYLKHGWQYVQGLSAVSPIMFFCLQGYVPESPKWLLAQFSNGVVLKNGKSGKSGRTGSVVSEESEKVADSTVLGKDYTPVRLEIEAGEELGSPEEVDDVDDHYKQAKEIIQGLRPDGYNVEEELAIILSHAQDDADNEDDVTWAELFEKRRVVIIGFGLAFFHAMTGIDSVVFYSTTIFSMAGFSQSIIGSVIFGFVNCFMTLVSVVLVDHAGRRVLLLRGCYIMLGSLIVLAVVLLSNTPSEAQGGVAVAAVLLYVTGYSIGLGAVMWVIMPEIMSTRLRMKAVTLFLSAKMAPVLLISLVSLPAIDGMGGVRSDMDDDAQASAEKKGVAFLYIIFAAFTVANIVFVHALVPETKGKTHLDF
eukprot:gene135-145_t